MNEIFEKLIKWCVENNLFAEVGIEGDWLGGFYPRICISNGRKKITHLFYIAGGVLSVDNWKDQRNDIELKLFLGDAIRALKGGG